MQRIMQTAPVHFFDRMLHTLGLFLKTYLEILFKLFHLQSKLIEIKIIITFFLNGTELSFPDIKRLKKLESFQTVF